MVLLSLFLTLVTISLNLPLFNIPKFTNQPLVQSNTTQLTQLQQKRNTPTIPEHSFQHRYNASPVPIKLASPIPSFIPTPVPTVKTTVTPTATPTPAPKPTITPAPTIQPTVVPTQVEGNLNSQSLFNAINNYRIRNGLPALTWDQKLADYAQTRANSYQQSGSMDHHAGFKQLTSNADGFYQLGFRKLGENSSSGFSGSPVELVEGLYAGSPKHQENQLNSGWSHMGTGVSGGFTNIVFGGGKI